MKCWVVFGKDYWGCSCCGSGCSVKIVGVYFDEDEAKRESSVVRYNDSYDYDYEEVNCEIPVQKE